MNSPLTHSVGTAVAQVAAAPDADFVTTQLWLREWAEEAYQRARILVFENPTPPSELNSQQLAALANLEAAETALREYRMLVRPIVPSPRTGKA